VIADYVATRPIAWTLANTDSDSGEQRAAIRANDVHNR
jgi:hypothetical protein